MVAQFVSCHDQSALPAVEGRIQHEWIVSRTETKRLLSTTHYLKVPTNA